jgi:hypothetical protein
MQAKISLPLSPRHTLVSQSQKLPLPSNPHLAAITPLTLCLLQRNRIIDLLYRGQKSFQFSRSTLHLAVGVLDKLICLGCPLSNSNPELLAGSLLLLATKFNEIYPVSLKKLNLLMKESFSREKYTEMESAILHRLDFCLYLEDSLYEQLALLESQYQGEESGRCCELIRLAVLNPSFTYKYGTKPLLLAIESQLGESCLKERASNGSYLHKEVSTIKSELIRL